MKKTTTKFDLTARVLHWLSAFVILWATISGLYIALFNLDPGIKHQILELNVLITVLFIPFFCWRVMHRIRHGVPSYHNLQLGNAIKIARFTHILLYTLVSIVLLSGILMMEQDISVFYLFSISQLVHNMEIQSAFKTLHLYTSRILAIMTMIHVLAVVKHEFSGRKILKRML